jgi:hypothetical protein
MRVINKRKFHLWHNHGGILYMHIINGQVLFGFLISMEGFIPSVLKPNPIFLGSLEKSSAWLRSNVSTVYHHQDVGSFHPSSVGHAKARFELP